MCRFLPEGVTLESTARFSSFGSVVAAAVMVDGGRIYIGDVLISTGVQWSLVHRLEL
jgi:hypothetical protein